MRGFVGRRIGVVCVGGFPPGVFAHCYSRLQHGWTRAQRRPPTVARLSGAWWIQARIEVLLNGHTGSCRALTGGDGSRHNRCRFLVLQRPILGTVDSEYWHCLGVRSFLLEIPQAAMNKAR